MKAIQKKVSQIKMRKSIIQLTQKRMEQREVMQRMVKMKQHQTYLIHLTTRTHC